VGKSCAELAPDLIRSALDESPLVENVRALARIGTRTSGSPAAGRAVDWAVNAFHRAGADEVHTEKFPIQTGGEKASSENVVAEIRGYQQSDEFVLLGASLDSAASAQDSFASACAVAALIDAVRVIHSSGSIPRHTIRFVLFAGSEQGMQGSQAYVRMHRADLDSLIATVFFAPGAGAIHGYSLDGRGDTLAAVREALEPAIPVGVKEFTVDAALGNNLDFILEGVPTLVVRQDNHAGPAGDLTPEVVAEFKRHSAIAAVTAYAFADSEARIGARQSHAQIEELLKNTGLDEQMKTAGIWSDWATGTRGRQK
jgi:Peptidase family M28